MAYFKVLSQHIRAQEAQWYSSELRVGWCGFESRQGLGIFLFTTVSRPALAPPPQPPIQWVPGSLSLRVKRPGREADHSPPTSVKVKNAWSYNFTSPIRLHGLVLKAQRQLYLYLYPAYAWKDWGKTRKLGQESRCPADSNRTSA
jgi:hypothetical protein